MANNRMYLAHVPTGLALQLGKRMGFGWYTKGGDLAMLQHFFDVLEELGYPGGQDDFALLMENAEGAPSALDKWDYSPIEREDGLELVKITKNG